MPTTMASSTHDDLHDGALVEDTDTLTTSSTTSATTSTNFSATDSLCVGEAHQAATTMTSSTHEEALVEDTEVSTTETTSTTTPSTLSVTDNVPTSQILAIKDSASSDSDETQQALAEQFSKLQSPAEIVEFITRAPLEFQKLITSMSRMNATLTTQNLQLTDQNQQLTTRVNSLSQCVEVLQTCEGVFWQFSRMPLEIRDVVWKFASDVPRLIQVRIVDRWFWDDEELPACSLNCYPGKVPAVLHASRESRQQALKSYELCREEAQGQYSRKSLGRCRYSNHEYDILYFGYEFWRDVNDPDMGPLPTHFPVHQGFSNSKLRRLAFAIETWTGGRNMSIIHFSGMYPNLKELIFIDDTPASVCETLFAIRLIPEDEEEYLSQMASETEIKRELVYASDFLRNATKLFKKEINSAWLRQCPNMKNLWLEERMELPDIRAGKIQPLDILDSSIWLDASS